MDRTEFQERQKDAGTQLRDGSVDHEDYENRIALVSPETPFAR
jgi:hypothetical protein